MQQWSERGLGRVLGIVGMLVLATGCQVGPRPILPEGGVGKAGSTGQCVPIQSLGGYRVLDERSILVDVGSMQKVIEVYSDCDGLRFAEDIGVEGRSGQVCDYRTDKLLVNGRRCTIASIRDYDVAPDLIQQHRLQLNEEELFPGVFDLR